MNVETSCHSPYITLGCHWKSISGSCLWKGRRQEEGQAARPGPAAPIQGAGTILALTAVVPAKLGWWKFQGLGPGFESRQRLYCEHCWEKGLHHGLDNPRGQLQTSYLEQRGQGTSLLRYCWSQLDSGKL